MRSKELAHDYRYFPDPDLLPLTVTQDWIDSVRAALPELPAERRARFVHDYRLPAYDAEVLTTRKDVAEYYEAAVRAYPADPKTLSNWVMESVLRVIKDEQLDTGLKVTKWPCPPEHLGALVRLIGEGKISGKIAKTVFDEMRRSGKTPEIIVAEQGLTQVRDEGALAAQIDQVLAANPEKVAEYRAGRDKLLQFFVGQAMKATQGKANPQMLNELLKKKLSVDNQ
jgi:aspartyl-tRNA(Asn)/glutamyl-tRNA(Gln) amidotransferase subunit B